VFRQYQRQAVWSAINYNMECYHLMELGSLEASCLAAWALSAAGYSHQTNAGTLLGCSLVPRPFTPQLFDHLQYVNVEAEGLGGLVTCGDKKRIKPLDQNYKKVL